MEWVVIQLYVGDSPEAVVSKVWCFDTSNIEQYYRRAVEVEVVQLFPDVAQTWRQIAFQLSPRLRSALQVLQRVKQVYTYWWLAVYSGPKISIFDTAQ